MNRRTLLATCVALLVLPAAALAAREAAATASGVAVKVRVEGLGRTLLGTKTVIVGSGWITHDGAPRGKCPARSAAGALDRATRHRWGGVWETSFGDYEVTSILGEKHTFSSKDYWEVFVNNKTASSGVCETSLHRGTQLLFAAVPQKGTEYPLRLTVLSKPLVGRAFSVKVVFYNANGKPKPLAGATVTASGISAEPIPHNQTSAQTNSNGVATLTVHRQGLTAIGAAKRGYIRAAAVVRDVSP